MAISKREGLSFVQYESDGVTQNFPFSFTYLDRAFIFVRVGSVLTTDFTFVNSNEIRLNTAAPSGVIVTISRITEGEEKLVDFQDSGIITEKLLDTEFDQVMNLVQEAKDVANSSVFIDIDTMTGDAGFARLINVADAVDPQDAMNKRTTEAMFEDFSDEFNAKLVEIQGIEDNVEQLASDVSDTNSALTTKYNQVVTMSNTMTTQLSQAQDARDAAVVAQGDAEDARDLAASYALAASISAGEAEDFKDQAQDIADSLGTILTEFPDVKDSVDQLEIDIADTVRLTATQTVTNKTLSGSSIVNPTRTDVKADTYNNLVTYATTATDGQTVFAYDLGKFYGVVGGFLKDLGGGGSGSLDTIVQLTADEQLSDWTLSGTSSGKTFTKLTGSNAIQGENSYSLYANGSFGPTSVELNSPIVPLDKAFRQQEVVFDFLYTYNNSLATTNISIQTSTDGTSFTTLATVVAFKSLDGSTIRYGQIKTTIPSNATHIRVNISCTSIAAFTNFTLNFDSVRLRKVTNDIYWGGIKGNLSDQTDLNTQLVTLDQTKKETYKTVFSIYNLTSISGWTGAVLNTTVGANIQGNSVVSCVFNTAASATTTITSPNYTVSPVFKGKRVVLRFPHHAYFQNIPSSCRVFLYDVTNSLEIGNSSMLITDSGPIITGGPKKVIASTFELPTNTSSIQLRIEMINNATSGTDNSLIFTSVELTTDLEEVLANINNISEVTSYNTTTITLPAATDTKVVNTTLMGDTTNYSISSGDILIQKAGKYKIRLDTCVYGNNEQVIIKIGINGVTSPILRYGFIDINGSGSYSNIPAEWIFDVPNNTIVALYVQTPTSARNMRNNTVSISSVSSNPNIVTQTETFSSDTAPLTYASSSQYTLTTLANAPIGTYITFTYAANTNTRTQTTTRPTQTDADMNVNGMQIFTRAYNAASTAASPAAFAIQIGKGMKGTSLNLYKSVGRSISGEIDYCQTSNTSSIGLTVKSYNESTGILIIDAGNQQPTTTNSNIRFSDTTEQTNGYITINASKNPALVGVNAPKRYVVKTYSSGTDAYTVYNDGWVEQRGYVTNVSGTLTNTTTTYIIPMKDTNYNISITNVSTATSTPQWQDMSVVSFNSSQLVSRTSTAVTKFYEIKGYASASALAAMGIIVNY